MATTANAVTRLETASARKEAERIKTLFSSAAESQIDLAYALEHFFSYKLHTHLGYSTMAEAYDALFDVSHSHIHRLRTIASRAWHLGYTQKQIENIYARTGHLTALSNYLIDLEAKVSVPNAVKDLTNYNYTGKGPEQITINVSGSTAKKAEKLLRQLGMKVENGRRTGMAEAHRALIDLAEQQMKKRK